MPSRGKESLLNAHPFSYWQTFLPSSQTFDSLAGESSADLVIIGAGFTGLWAAIEAKDRYPHLDVVVVDGGLVGSAASSRNGGFISESLTHGHAHGEKLWPKEMKTLVRLGRENIEQIQTFLKSEGIDAGLNMCGKRVVATAPHHVPELERMAKTQEALGERVEIYDRVRAQAEVHSPTYLGALRIFTGSGLVHPSKLLHGLIASASKRGVTIYENSKVEKIESNRAQVLVHTAHARIAAGKVILATNAFSPLLKRIAHRVLPLFEHVLATEKLTSDQLASIGWKGDEGITDMGNQFHYYRKTEDARIIWGGYDAQYYFNNNTSPLNENHPISHELLANQFHQTFPSFEGVNFEYKWAGMIDSTSRFTPYFGNAYQGRVAYAVGYTGLGVGASRFGAKICLDMLYSKDSPLLQLEMVRKKPFPFPPEPLRFLAVEFTRKQLQKEDANGHRSLWLKVLDSLHVGLNS